LKQEIEDDARRWKDCPRSRNSRINIVNVTVILKKNLQIQCNAHQNPSNILHGNRKSHPKIHMKAQKTLNSQSNPEQQGNDGSIKL
jgi:hypothetical protein